MANELAFPNFGVTTGVKAWIHRIGTTDAADVTLTFTGGSWYEGDWPTGTSLVAAAWYLVYFVIDGTTVFAPCPVYWDGSAIAAAPPSSIPDPPGLSAVATDAAAAASDASDVIALVDDIPNDILDSPNAIETSITLRQALRLILAVLAGKCSGADSNAPVYRAADDSKDRVSASTDADGNRTSVTLDAS